MAFPVPKNAAFKNASATSSAVDLTNVTSVCPANERAGWNIIISMVDDALAMQVDEIHLEPDDHCLRLRLRTPFSFNETRIEDAEKHLASLDLLQGYLWSERIRSQPRRSWFSLSLQTGPRLLQLDVVPTSRGDTYLLTILQNLKNPPPRLDGLAMSRRQKTNLRDMLKIDAGLILLASTHAQARIQTARAIAQELVAPDRKIACIDAPGHPLLPRMTQISLDNLNISEQQRLWPALLELGSNAIVACQMGSEQMTQQLARLACGSTLVVQGVNVNSPADAVSHLLSQGVRSEAIAQSLKGVVVQHKLQCLCPYCRSPEPPDDQGMAWLAKHSPIKPGNINDWLRHRMRSSFSGASGCDKCQYTGLGNNLDLFALVTLDDEIRDALYLNAIRLALSLLNTKPFLATDLLRLAQEGIITLNEAARLAPLHNENMMQQK